MIALYCTYNIDLITKYRAVKFRFQQRRNMVESRSFTNAFVKVNDTIITLCNINVKL